MHLGQDMLYDFARVVCVFSDAIKAGYYVPGQKDVGFAISDIGAGHAAFSANGPMVAVQRWPWLFNVLELPRDIDIYYANATMSRL